MSFFALINPRKIHNYTVNISKVIKKCNKHNQKITKTALKPTSLLGIIKANSEIMGKGIGGYVI